MRTLFVLALLGMPVALAAPASAAPSVALVPLPVDDVALLSWDAVPGASEYRVYRGASPDRLELVGVVRAPAFLDESPAAGEPTYAVDPVFPEERVNRPPVGVRDAPCVRVSRGGVTLHLKECLTR